MRRLGVLLVACSALLLSLTRENFAQDATTVKKPAPPQAAAQAPDVAAQKFGKDGEVNRRADDRYEQLGERSGGGDREGDYKDR